MYPSIARTFYTISVMNTHATKWTVHKFIEEPPADRLDNAYYIYPLPQWLCHNNSIAVIDKMVTDYALGYYSPELVENQKNQQQVRFQEECRKRAELLVQMRRKLWYAHKFSKDENGEEQIKWWDHWGAHNNRVIVKKEEPVEPSIKVKKEEPPTPNLEYPITPESPDPNAYEWDPQKNWVWH